MGKNMTRGILLLPPAWSGLILVGIVFVLLTDVFSLLLPSQLSVALADEADSATVQYSLGVSEYNEGNVESARVWFQRAYESLEGDKGARLATALKTQKFGSRSRPLEATPAKVQFPEGYKVDVYYRDGWYIQPKDSPVGNALTPVLSQRNRELVYSFLPGSTYKIRVEAENEQNKHEQINMGVKVIAALVMVSWLMSR